jgi:hypothetical protein
MPILSLHICEYQIFIMFLLHSLCDILSTTDVFLNIFFVGMPHSATYIFLYFFSNEPELGTEIDTGMVMTPFPSSILGRDSNPQPESNLLTTRPD